VSDALFALFALSTTQDPKEQGLSTLRVLIQFWPCDSNPDVVYGYLIGYAGGGDQADGGFKYVRSTGAYCSLTFCEDAEVGGCWDRVVGDASDALSETDVENIGGLSDSNLWDALDTDGPEDVDFDCDISGGSVFLPSTLKSMSSGYGRGVFTRVDNTSKKAGADDYYLAFRVRSENFYLWQGVPDDALLAQLSLHWPLVTEFMLDGVEVSDD
jgi:hypothetical protein